MSHGECAKNKLKIHSTIPDIRLYFNAHVCRPDGQHCSFSILIPLPPRPNAAGSPTAFADFKFSIPI